MKSDMRHHRELLPRPVRASTLLLLALLFGLPVSPTAAIINPRFTPADLFRASAQIVLLRVSRPDQQSIVAEAVETIRGTPLPGKTLHFSYAEAEELEDAEVRAAFGSQPAATGILLIGKARPRGGDAPIGLLQVNTQWFAVHGGAGQWRLERDKREMLSAWAGSAGMLASAARAAEADPALAFPVRSLMSWGKTLDLGKVAGSICGSTAADLGQPLGPCVIVLSTGGDRIFRPGTPTVPPTDVTASLQLKTASRCAAIGDYNGDGRLDVASWDGEALAVALRSADGTFHPPSMATDLGTCLSLDPIAHEGAPGAALVAGTQEGPAVLIPEATGRLRRSTLPPPAAKLGAGGRCVVADIDGDGRCDIVQLFTGGAVVYRAMGPGRFEIPTTIPLPLVQNPRIALCGDYDADGQLDLAVGGDDGVVLLMRDQRQQWEVATAVSGELAYHGNANQPRITAAWPCDINQDGRQGMALFYPDRPPLLFFNRGFACFGLARELELSRPADLTEGADPDAAVAAPRSQAQEALSSGQLAGTIADLNGDGAPDLLGIDPQNQAYALLGKADEPRPSLVISLSSQQEAVTVAVHDDKRLTGLHVVKPGVPAQVGRTGPGKLRLEWAVPGAGVRQLVVDLSSSARAELTR